MSARDRPADFQAIAAIRGLQSRAAELEVARAAGESRSKAEEERNRAAALDETERGWAAALGGASFDPALARHWSADVAARQDDERRAKDAARTAEAALAERRTAWHGAIARAETAEAQAHAASSKAARRRDEARLAVLEDRAAFLRRPRP
jgi:hypothetical protein